MEHIANHKEEVKARILSHYNTIEKSKDAHVITKSDFEIAFPKEQFEIYSLEAIDKFRDDLQKANDDFEPLFKEATKDLQSFIVHGDQKRVIMFVRNKQKSEE